MAIKLADLRLSGERAAAARLEDERRINAIQSGLHLDTGKPLCAGDEDYLDPYESFIASNRLYPERGMRYLEDVLVEIAELYQRNQNPLLAWEAFMISTNLGRPLPEWASLYFMNCARALFDERFEPTRQSRREAERAGRLIGFGNGRHFGAATMRERDTSIALEIKAWLDEERSLGHSRPKISQAWEEIAERRGVDRSTIERAWRRMAGRKIPALEAG